MIRACPPHARAHPQAFRWLRGLRLWRPSSQRLRSSEQWCTESPRVHAPPEESGRCCEQALTRPLVDTTRGHNMGLRRRLRCPATPSTRGRGRHLAESVRGAPAGEAAGRARGAVPPPPRACPRPTPSPPASASPHTHPRPARYAVQVQKESELNPSDGPGSVAQVRPHRSLRQSAPPGRRPPRTRQPGL